MLAIVLSVLLRYTDSDYLPLVSSNSSCSIFNFPCNILQIVVCPFVLFLLSIVLSVLLRFSASDYPFDILVCNLFFSCVY